MTEALHESGPDASDAMSWRTRLRVIGHVLRGKPVAYRLRFEDSFAFAPEQRDTMVTYCSISQRSLDSLTH